MFTLLSGKYFNNKELFVGSFTKVMQLMEKESPWIKSPEFRVEFIQMCSKQIERFALSNMSYKNKVVECLTECLVANKESIFGVTSELLEPT